MSTLEAALRIRLQPKQSELWKLWDESNFTRIGFGGSRGGTKSGGGRRLMLLRRFKYPKTTGLILRRTFNPLYQSHIEKLFQEFPALQDWYNAQHKELVFPNGSILYFGSAEHEGDMSKFYSAEYADIMPDEAQEFSQGELEQLSGSNRCTTNSEIVPKMVFTFMPGMSADSGLPPKGLAYLKRVFVDRDLKREELKQSWTFLQAFSWDNIEWARNELNRDGVSETQFYAWSSDERRDYFINRTVYGANLAALTNEYLRDAWLYGKWDKFQGQFFPQFTEAKHVLSAIDTAAHMKPWHTRWISGDWGYEHPHAIYWHCQDENGKVITYREQWGQRVGETNLGIKISALNAGEKCNAFPFSWDAGKLSPRSQPSLPKSMMQLLSDALGPGVPKPHPADSSPGSRVSGARLLSQLLDAGMWQISEDCPKLIQCLPTLMRNPDNMEDVLKVDFSENGIGDDCYDAARMGLQHMLSSPMVPVTVMAERKVAAFAKNLGKEVEDLDVNTAAQLHRRALFQENRRRAKRRGGLGAIRRPVN